MHVLFTHIAKKLGVQGPHSALLGLFVSPAA